MAPQLWALVALLENHSLICSIYMVANSISTNQTLSAFVGTACMWYRDMQSKHT